VEAEYIVFVVVVSMP